MKTRIIAGVSLAAVLFLVVLVLPKEVAAVIMGVLQAVAAYELLYRTRLVTKPRLVLLRSNPCLFCADGACLFPADVL